MLAGNQLKFDIRRMEAKARLELRSRRDREEFVLRSGDVQNWRRNSIRRRPLLGYAPAQPDRALNHPGMAGEEAVIQAHWLRKPQQQHRQRRQLCQYLQQDTVMQADRPRPIGRSPPVVPHFNARKAFEIVRVRTLDSGYGRPRPQQPPGVGTDQCGRLSIAM